MYRVVSTTIPESGIAVLKFLDAIREKIKVRESGPFIYHYLPVSAVIL